MLHFRLALPAVALLLGAVTGCVDNARFDAVEAALARTRAETAAREAQRDQQIAWLRWGESLLSQRVATLATTEREVLLRRLVALEDENSVLAQRLAQAEGRLGAPPATAPAPPPVGAPSPQAPPPVRAPARRVDNRTPYELVVDRRKAEPVRVLDETVPY